MSRLVSALTLSLLTLCPIASLTASVTLESKVHGNVYAVTQPLCHANGMVAWYGVRQGKDYQQEFAFHLPDGRVCWGGMKQLGSDSNYSKFGAFWWDSGERAWGGYSQDTGSYFLSDKATFHHRNGATCWSGRVQERSAYHRDWDHDQRHSFKHDNGKVAWGGLSQMDLSSFSKHAAVYHSNGKLAWNGEKGGAVYDAYGNLVAISADFINISLGTGVVLFVDYTGRFELRMALAEGMNLRVHRRSVYFDCYDLSMEVTQ